MVKMVKYVHICPIAGWSRTFSEGISVDGMVCVQFEVRPEQGVWYPEGGR